MKVVHFGKFYPPHRGGMESFLAALCQGLVQRGVECEVIVAQDRDDPSDNDHGGIIVRRLRSREPAGPGREAEKAGGRS